MPCVADLIRRAPSHPHRGGLTENERSLYLGYAPGPIFTTGYLFSEAQANAELWRTAEAFWFGVQKRGV